MKGRIFARAYRSGFLRRGFASLGIELSDRRKRPATTLAPAQGGVSVLRCLGCLLDVLTFLQLLQLILYIPLLALVGQGLLFVLAGPKRDSNFFYRLLQVLSKPFTLIVRRITPARVADRQVPIVTFFLVLIAYFVVTFERIDLCVKLGLEQCK
jgi:hypothetical protein